MSPTRARREADMGQTEPEKSVEPQPRPEQDDGEPEEGQSEAVPDDEVAGDGLNIHEAMARVMAIVQPVGKTGWNQQQQYKFRSIDAVMTALQPAMAAAGVHVVPKTLKRLVDDSHVTGNRNVLRWVDVKMRLRFFGPQGDHVDVIVWGEGRDSADKATAKAYTAAYKYGLLEAFCIATDDTADADKDHFEAEPSARDQGRADRRAQERAQQQGPPPPVTDPDRVRAAILVATSRDNLGAHLHSLGLAARKEDGSWGYRSDLLAAMEVGDVHGQPTNAWDLLRATGAGLPPVDVADESQEQPTAQTEAEVRKPLPVGRPVDRSGPGEQQPDQWSTPAATVDPDAEAEAEYTGGT